MSDREAVGHRPVLLDEAVDALNIRPDGCYVDGTFGRGGHSGEILRRLGPTGRLIAMDRDPEAIAHARQRFGDDPRFSLQPGAFSSLGEVCRSLGVSGEVDGILLDLGVSSPQLDDPARGFSFQADGPLDMRMDPSAGQSAAEWLNRAKEDDIAQVLRDYGEERFAKRIARAIVRERQAEPFLRSARLAAVISSANPKWERDKHPATRSFQAIRIVINRELEELHEVLPQTVSQLRSGGRLAVISFHSLEDRMVKRFLRDQARGRPLPHGLPVAESQRDLALRLVGKAIHAGERELALNPRARSAVLRVAEKR
ncbi:MAG: 16S rRNA (cytosine(1402)-N(4))-methyltransferase RsmH [Chromatiales bacterium]|nr:16S rRNA (cytosine(1402)-N(4))-methyltransferase RsmH [Chromatiales bacterium]